MSILDNELVKTYFLKGKCTCFGIWMECDHLACASERVFAAMEQPIKKDERYMAVFRDSVIKEAIWTNSSDIGGWHPYYLRLPDRFQTKECAHGELKCMGCNLEMPENTKPDPVESKIQEIMNNQPMPLKKSVDALRDLVRLARAPSSR